MGTQNSTELVNTWSNLRKPRKVSKKLYQTKKKKKANQYKNILIESTINKPAIDFLLHSTNTNTHDTYILNT